MSILAHSRYIDRDVSYVLDGIGIRGSQSDRVLSELQRIGGRASLDSDNVEAILLLMVDTMGIKIGKVKDIIVEYPRILLQSPVTLKGKYESLLSAWPSKSQLAGSIYSYPMIFDDDFPEKLRKFMDAMMEIGFDKDEVAKMLIKEPGLVLVRKFELLNIVKRFRVDIHDQKQLKPILRFFGKNPSLLFPTKFKDVFEKLQKLEKEADMPFDTAVSIVVQNSKILDHCERNFDSIRHVVSDLKEYGMEHEDVMRVLRGYPAMVTMDTERVRLTLTILKTFQIPISDIIQYPRVFCHDPNKVIGPRLSYVSKHCGEKMKKLRLSTLLTAGDASFIAKYVKSLQDFENAKKTYGRASVAGEVSGGHASTREVQQGEQSTGSRQPATRSPKKPSQTQKKPQKRFWRRKLQRLPKQNPGSSSTKKANN